MPSSASTSSAASNGGRCCQLCEVEVNQCQMLTCTPIDALPGYQDQQLLPLPPVPQRERGRSRGHHVGRGQKQPPPIFTSSQVILSTPSEANSSNSSLVTSSSLSTRWRPQRRRSASTRQRQGASLIRESTEVQIDNCPLCQPRYSRSPARLAKQRPPRPHPEVSHKLSYPDHLLKASKRKPSTLLRLEVNSSAGGHRGRRSRSEFRPLKMNDENVNPLNLHPNYRRVSRDLNGNENSDYAEVSLGELVLEKKNKRVSRSKSRSKANSGLMTIWPGKTGIWLPQ